MVRGLRGYYNSYAGQVYFDRMGLGLDAAAITELHEIIELSVKAIGKTTLDWLDVGCGNGRHLAHMHKHMPHIHLSGLELSDLGVEYCQKLEKSERLPMGCVTQGDIRLAPYASGRFDVVYSRMSLHHLPHFAGLNIGFYELIEEMKRITKPGGLIVTILPIGAQSYFSLPSFTMRPETYNQYFNNQWQLIQQNKIMRPPQAQITQRSFQHAFDGFLVSIHQKKPNLS